METVEEKKEIKQNIRCLSCYLKKEIVKLQAENRSLRYTIKEIKEKNEMFFLHIHRLQNTLIALGVNSKGFL